MFYRDYESQIDANKQSIERFFASQFDTEYTRCERFLFEKHTHTVDTADIITLTDSIDILNIFVKQNQDDTFYIYYKQMKTLLLLYLYREFHNLVPLLLHLGLHEGLNRLILDCVDNSTINIDDIDDIDEDVSIEQLPTFNDNMIEKRTNLVQQRDYLKNMYLKYCYLSYQMIQSDVPLALRSSHVHHLDTLYTEYEQLFTSIENDFDLYRCNYFIIDIMSKLKRLPYFYKYQQMSFLLHSDLEKAKTVLETKWKITLSDDFTSWIVSENKEAPCTPWNGPTWFFSFIQYLNNDFQKFSEIYRHDYYEQKAELICSVLCFFKVYLTEKKCTEMMIKQCDSLGILTKFNTKIAETKFVYIKHIYLLYEILRICNQNNLEYSIAQNVDNYKELRTIAVTTLFSIINSFLKTLYSTEKPKTKQAYENQISIVYTHIFLELFSILPFNIQAYYKPFTLNMKDFNLTAPIWTELFMKQDPPYPIRNMVDYFNSISTRIGQLWQMEFPPFPHATSVPFQ